MPSLASDGNASRYFLHPSQKTQSTRFFFHFVDPHWFFREIAIPPFFQDALVELSEHGIVLIVEESGCLQAKVYLQREVSISRNSDSPNHFVEIRNWHLMMFLPVWEAIHEIRVWSWREAEIWNQLRPSRGLLEHILITWTFKHRRNQISRPWYGASSQVWKQTIIHPLPL